MKNEKAIRARIQKRANNRCERCLAKNGSTILRSADLKTYWIDSTLSNHGYICDAKTGEMLKALVSRPPYYAGKNRPIKIICKVARLDGGLAFLCQRCALDAAG